MLDVSVVIRASGERTEKLCREIISQQVPSEQVFLIKERPFWKAVQRTFEIGVEQGRKWTLAVDADVLLKTNCISEMIQNATSYENLYVYQGYVFDYIFGKARSGGPHLYVTERLPMALDSLTSNPNKLRPESDTYKTLSQKDYKCVSDSKIFGIHDFGQWRKDLFRKAFIHAQKHSEPKYTGSFIQYWRDQYLKGDENMYVLLKGWFEGVINKNKSQADISLLNEVGDRVTTLNVEEHEKPNTFETNKLKQLVEELSNYDLPSSKKISPAPASSFITRVRRFLSYRLLKWSEKLSD